MKCPSCGFASATIDFITRVPVIAYAKTVIDGSLVNQEAKLKCPKCEYEF